MENQTNVVWQSAVSRLLNEPDFTVCPRGLEVSEIIGGRYSVPMPAYLDLIDRKVNVPFMFAEAAWLVSGSNRLQEVTPYMKVYENYSDDGVFLRGAYGPKIVDQLGYVVDALVADRDSRQAVMNLWRERPGTSKDIPCTLSFQFIIRSGELHLVTSMRSHDIVKGFTYDVFSFSMVAMAVRLLLRQRGVKVTLGNMYLTAGSLHLYETDYVKAQSFLLAADRDDSIRKAVNQMLLTIETYEDLIASLWDTAERLKK